MKPTLQLKLNQKLTVNPQLRYAIKLLQLSKLELDLEIHSALEANPMLESCENEIDTAHLSADDYYLDTVDFNFSKEQLPTTIDLTSSSPAKTTENLELDFTKATTQTLYEQLLWQLNLTPFSVTDNLIAKTIIECIDDSGYLSCDLDEIHKCLQKITLEVSVEEIETVLHRVQQFEPLGVGARNLQECLQIQLNALPANTKFLTEAKLIVDKYLRLLANKKHTELAAKLKLKSEQITPVIDLLLNLTPRPGDLVTSDKTEYITPDVIIQKQANRWVVKLNKDLFPNVRLNQEYVTMFSKKFAAKELNASTLATSHYKPSSKEKTFISSQLSDAKCLLKGLHSRNETLLKVARCIVAKQEEFLEHGAQAMVPMILQDVATQTELHESTVSRITTKKYMLTPQGIYELKFFFSSSIKTTSGQEYSATAIRAIVKALIAKEDSAKPLSDNKITVLLTAKGISIARRTVTKYREAMRIPASNRRKTLLH